MVKSLLPSEENELQTKPNDPLPNQNFRNVNQSDHSAGSLSKEIQFSENSWKPIDSEHGLLRQMSPSSDVSFGWEEITESTRSVSRNSSHGIERVNVPNKFYNECANSSDNINMTPESSDSDDSLEGKEERSLSSFGVTAASKEESSLKEAREVLAHSKDLAAKPDLSEKVPKNIYRMKKTHDVSESEDSYSQKLTKDNCKKKKTHDVLRREDSESDREMPSLLTDEDYGTVKIGDTLKLENLTEEEEIWMVQCPISLNPQYLENKELVFGGTSEFTLQHSAQRYETTSYVDRIKPVLCLLPSRKKGIFKARVLQPEGLMVIMEKVEIPELKITLPKQSNFQIPKGLKVRHPLFGRDYKQELEVRKQFTSQCRRMIHEDLLIQPNRLKKEKKKKSRSVKSDSTSEGTTTCYERGKWQTHDEEEQESYKKEKKKKEKNCDAEEHMRKRKLEDIFEGSEIVYDTKRRKKDKYENIH